MLVKRSPIEGSTAGRSSLLAELIHAAGIEPDTKTGSTEDDAGSDDAVKTSVMTGDTVTLSKGWLSFILEAGSWNYCCIASDSLLSDAVLGHTPCFKFSFSLACFPSLTLRYFLPFPLVFYSPSTLSKVSLPAVLPSLSRSSLSPQLCGHHLSLP